MSTMTAASNTFDASRFLRVFRNDFAQQWRRIWIATIGAFGLGLVIYMTNVDPRQPDEPALFAGLFPLALIIGGLLFTASIFADVHHPLQRFQSLTLPCSNLERFLSRYLLTGPLFFLYTLVAYAVFDAAAAMLAQAWLGKRAAAFDLTATPIWQFSATWFFLHACMLLGAVYFRSYALIKTGLVATVLSFTMIVVHVVAVRLTYWEYFTGVLPDDGAVLPELVAFTQPEPLVLMGFLLHLWVLYLAYLTLCEHEVQE